MGEALITRRGGGPKIEIGFSYDVDKTSGVVQASNLTASRYEMGCAECNDEAVFIGGWRYPSGEQSTIDAVNARSRTTRGIGNLPQVQRALCAICDKQEGRIYAAFPYAPKSGGGNIYMIDPLTNTTSVFSTVSGTLSSNNSGYGGGGVLNGEVVFTGKTTSSITPITCVNKTTKSKRTVTPPAQLSCGGSGIVDAEVVFISDAGIYAFNNSSSTVRKVGEISNFAQYLFTTTGCISNRKVVGTTKSYQLIVFDFDTHTATAPKDVNGKYYQSLTAVGKTVSWAGGGNNGGDYPVYDDVLLFNTETLTSNLSHHLLRARTAVASVGVNSSAAFVYAGGVKPTATSETSYADAEVLSLIPPNTIEMPQLTLADGRRQTEPLSCRVKFNDAGVYMGVSYPPGSTLELGQERTITAPDIPAEQTAIAGKYILKKGVYQL